MLNNYDKDVLKHASSIIGQIVIVLLGILSPLILSQFIHSFHKPSDACAIMYGLGFIYVLCRVIWFSIYYHAYLHVHGSEPNYEFVTYKEVTKLYIFLIFSFLSLNLVIKYVL